MVQIIFNFEGKNEDDESEQPKNSTVLSTDKTSHKTSRKGANQREIYVYQIDWQSVLISHIYHTTSFLAHTRTSTQPATTSLKHNGSLRIFNNRRKKRSC